MVSNNIKAAGLSLLFGTAGDLFSRMWWFNCSVDKLWTTLFMLPPLSIVTAYMHFMGKIEKAGPNCGSAFDWFLLIMPMIGIMLSMLLPKMIESGNIIQAITLLSSFAMFMMVRLYKYRKMCKIHFPDTETGFNSNHIVRAGVTSAVVNIIIVVINMLAPYLKMLPVIGIAFRIWGMLGMIPGLQHVLPLTVAHLIINFYENLQSHLEPICIEDGE